MQPQPTGIRNNAISENIGTPLIDPASAISKILSTLINFALVIGCITFVFMFLFGGYQWITSGGNKDSLQKAKNRITNALIGLVVLLSLYAILNFLSSFLGIDLIKFDLPTL